MSDPSEADDGAPAPDEATAPDGGAVAEEATPPDEIVDQFQGIALARKARWLGAAALLSAVVYLFLMALETVEWFRSDLPSYVGNFLTALQNYFPFLVFGDGGIGFDPSGFGEYASFILQRELLFESAFFSGAEGPLDYLVLVFTQTGGPIRLFGAAGETLAIGLAGTIMGFPLALLFSILGSGRVLPFPLNFLFRGVMSLIRAIPALVWALIYVPLGGISPTTATLAVATDTVGNLGRLFSDELEEIEDGPVEAMRTTGASKPQVIVFGMLAQVRNSFIAWALYIFEINVRVAVGLGIIGAGGLGLVLNVQQGLFKFTNMMATIIVIFMLIVSVEMFSQRMRSYLRSNEEPMTVIQLVVGFPERLLRSLLR